MLSVAQNTATCYIHHLGGVWRTMQLPLSHRRPAASLSFAVLTIVPFCYPNRSHLPSRSFCQHCDLSHGLTPRSLVTTLISIFSHMVAVRQGRGRRRPSRRLRHPHERDQHRDGRRGAYGAGGPGLQRSGSKRPRTSATPDCVQALAAEPSAAVDFADADRKVAHQVVDWTISFLAVCTGLKQRCVHTVCQSAQPLAKFCFGHCHRTPH